MGVSLSLFCRKFQRIHLCPRVAGVEMSDRMALGYQKNLVLELQVKKRQTNIDSCTFPSLIPPIARASMNEAKEVD